jgi:hypothetical protein
MAHGYGFWTFGWIQAERTAARIGRFNERWHRLTTIHDYVRNELLTPLDTASAKFTPLERGRLIGYASAMGEWFNAINSNVSNARQNHLSRYATAIKITAMRAIGLCKKYGVYNDITSYHYDARRKCVMLNGQELYYLG